MPSHSTGSDSNESIPSFEKSPKREASTPGTPNTEYSQFSTRSDVAVIGMACRVAGGNNDPEQLWKSLLEKRDFSGDIPPMRWEPYERRDVRNPKVLKQATVKGYFLDRLEDFDSAFFGISPKEAEQTDPQQRISLEVAYEALEDSGIPAKSLSGTDTAVFWGVNSDDYSRLLLEDLPNIEHNMGIGTAYCGVPNRISYHLNLTGPSTAVDAACASGLVSVHHGVQAILLGESSIAIAGGVQAMSAPGMVRVLDKAGAVSPEGRCRSFDDSAHGYGRGEGVGAVVLKNISQAIRDGDHILAVIKGTAVGQDGKTAGIMAPNGMAQQTVAKKALKVAGVDPSSIRYIEAHATSTPLGDPTEVSALATVYGKDRIQSEPCYIGSLKPNIGHLEAGAGTMGFIKAVMAVHKGMLAPQANLEKLTSKIDWANSGLQVVQETTKWPSEEGLRRAAVCSYGYGGTVSHAIIEQFSGAHDLSNSALFEAEIDEPALILISGPQEKRLTAQALSLKKWMESDASREHRLAHIASTLASRRDHHEFRAALVVDSHDHAIEVLETISSGKKSANVTQGRILGNEINKDMVWVFSGHGAQWPEMGKELLKNPAFYNAILPLDEIVKTEIGVSPISLLREGNFGSSDEVQILTYLMQIGISAVLNHRGLYPKAVIGHSVGEIAASVIGGTLTREEGTIIVTRRSVLYRQHMGKGAMILVNKPFAEIAAEIQGRDDLAAAIDSSPSSCVVAGSVEAIAKAAEDFKSRSIKVMFVKSDIAFHSPTLNDLIDPFKKVLEGALSPTRAGHVKLYSTSLADPRGQDLRTTDYWVNNMVNPVHLTSAVQAAVEDNYRVFLEISSHPLVSHSISETLMHAGIEDFSMIPTVLRNKPSQKSIMNAIAQLHCTGVEIDWKTAVPGPWAGGVPKTPWQHRPVWRKIESGPVSSSQLHDVEKHTLLGQRLDIAGTDSIVYTTQLDNDSKPFPGSHPLHGTEIVPAAGLINTFLKGTGASALFNIVLRTPVAINAPRSVQIISRPGEVKLVSRLIQDNGDAGGSSSWVTHTTAQWNSKPLASSDLHLDIEAVKTRIGTKLADNFSIDYLDKVGVSAMGFPWAVTQHYGNTSEMIARVDVAPDVAVDGELPWDPSSWAPILDAATSVGSTVFFDEPRLRMPAQIERVDIFTKQNPPKIGWLYVQKATGADLASHVSVLNDAGEVLAKFTSMRFSEIEGTPGASGSMESLVHRIAWPPATLAEEPLVVDHIVLVCDDQSTADQYTKSIPSRVKTTLLSAPQDLSSISSSISKGTAVVYVPGTISSLSDVETASETYTWRTLEVLKFVVNNSLPVKLFVVTPHILETETPTALAHGPLIGLSRVLASEHPEHFGGLIDTELTVFPLTEMRYVQGADIIRIRDGVPRTALLRSLPRSALLPSTRKNQLLPKPDGTYLITGGLGALGLAVAGFLVEQGARRIVLNSRRGLPPRSTWDTADASLAPVVAAIRALEAQGATVYILSLDISVAGAADALRARLEDLSLPPVRGIVHAAGVLENELALDTTQAAFKKVLAPKVVGGMVLHEVFPPQSVDFFVLFSSCGQLVGFTGQSSYGAGNSFLDSLATYRRAHGDKGAVAFQWTSWRGMGMGASTDFINAELESKGITDVTRDEAFAAWVHLAKYDIDHGVVLRSLALDEGEPLPSAILGDIVMRRTSEKSSSFNDDGKANGGAGGLPKAGPELNAYLDEKIRTCIGTVLGLPTEEVDSRAALSDLGVDSVMTVSLRRQLQQTLKVKVPPTLTWSHPTASHLVSWFAEKLGDTA
ncbi:6-methylsalicylic acid synthase [Boeremia exigua]|uniref:6-methylsalicylic acid synthase n=1 Tax=Boeremia exigua TaxID=749465 RepID=UPI001E8ED271|nr:6-methylsalicylic acid synthase [Boeremia exigua]KAH6644195.1 6-methylsalicylic acid synthase [Boeremia exigua]